MWIDGVDPLDVLEAFVAAGVAMFIFGIPAAIQQQRYSPITKDAAPGVRVDWARVAIVVFIVGGLLVSQLLTLYTTPVIYIFFDRVAARFSRGRASGRQEVVVAKA